MNQHVCGVALTIFGTMLAACNTQPDFEGRWYDNQNPGSWINVDKTTSGDYIAKNHEGFLIPVQITKDEMTLTINLILAVSTITCKHIDNQSLKCEGQAAGLGLKDPKVTTQILVRTPRQEQPQ